jgi:hypothetical protein
VVEADLLAALESDQVCVCVGGGDAARGMGGYCKRGVDVCPTACGLLVDPWGGRPVGSTALAPGRATFNMELCRAVWT